MLGTTHLFLFGTQPFTCFLHACLTISGKAVAFNLLREFCTFSYPDLDPVAKKLFSPGSAAKDFSFSNISFQ